MFPIQGLVRLQTVRQINDKSKQWSLCYTL